MIAKLTSGAVLLTLGAGTFFCGLQDDLPKQPNAKSFMIRKLDDSREIIAGLATEDFDLISKSAQDLMLLSHESEWNVIQSPPYVRMSSEFRGAAERLRDNANNKNLDGSTLAYFEVTLSCVRCHKYVRKSEQPKK